MPTLVRNLQDRLLELRQLRDDALARRDAVQTDELQAEIEALTAYLEEIFEGAVDAATPRSGPPSAPKRGWSMGSAQACQHNARFPAPLRSE